MFNLWSLLNSSIADKDTLVKNLEKFKPAFKQTLSGYFKTASNNTTSHTAKPNDLKPNEHDLMKKFVDILDLDNQICIQVYQDFLVSNYNKFQVADELFEKISVDELARIQFENFVQFYYRERFSFIKTLTLIASVVGENTIEDLDDEENSSYTCNAAIKQVFAKSDLELVCTSCMKDYTCLCERIKVFSSDNSHYLTNPLKTETFNQNYLIQAVNELELSLELILILTSVYASMPNQFYEVAKEFVHQSILKWLATSKQIHHINLGVSVDQISYLQVLICVKLTRVEKEVLDVGNSAKLSIEEKTKFITTDTVSFISELIDSLGSSQIASPVMLAYSSLLYSFSIDENCGKVLSKETLTIMNRMFAAAVKDNALNNLLNIFASKLFKNQEILWCLSQIVYDLVNSVLFLFDEHSLGDSLRILFDIAFFCLQQNRNITEHFWTSCKQPDRDNLTILMSHALDIFPINLTYTFTFFSLIAKTSPNLCKQIVDYLTHMDQYCEYLEDIDTNEYTNEYTTNQDSIKLVRNRKLFDAYLLNSGQRGTLISNSSALQQANKTASCHILQAPAVCWQLNYNCYELIRTYFNRIIQLSESNNLSGDQNVHSIIELIDSIYKYFFDIEELMTEREFEMNTKYIEMFSNSCFALFSNLMDRQWPDSYRLLAKLLEFFNSMSVQIYDKLIRLLQHNELIGYEMACEQLVLEQVVNNRHGLVKNLGKLKFIFQSGDKGLITNYVKLIDNLIKSNGNNIHYMNPLLFVLIYVFPDLYNWRQHSFDVDVELSKSCLNLIHTILNTSVSNCEVFSKSGQEQTSSCTIDKLCEAILLNTECSESLFNLIHVSYEYSNDQVFLNKVKKLDTVLMQTISLINRLIVVPTIDNSDESAQNCPCITIDQSALYLNLIKYINEQQTPLTQSSYDSCKALSDANIVKNNQFIMQLDVMMSKTGYSSSTKSVFDERNETNWFHLLTKIVIYKSNRTIDCLLFSLFKKIAQLTPLLFGSLLGPYANKIHSILLGKIEQSSQGQIISIICEFLCSLIENQPAFFQKLADLSEDNSERGKEDNRKLVEGKKSVLKALFNLLSQLKKKNSDYYVSISGIYSVFYTIWANKKLDYMTYCNSKSEFWPTLASTLHSIKREIDNSINQENSTTAASDYYDYFSMENLDYDSQAQLFNEFVIEANIKSVAYALKIYSIEIFELCFHSNSNSKNDMLSYFSENVFNKKLLEKWLDFYAFQLKRDLSEMGQFLFNTLEVENDQERIVKGDLSIIDMNLRQRKTTSGGVLVAPGLGNSSRELKSKLLLDSLTSLFLLVNKISRVMGPGKPDMLLETINLGRIKIDIVFNYFIESVLEIINHFLIVNNTLLLMQQEQEKMLEYEPPVAVGKKNNQAVKDFITLKQSNEIVKQFHSISSVLMVAITSLKTIDSSRLNLKQLVYDLVTILDRLMIEDFNYFPSVINAVQASLLHLFAVDNKNNTQNVIEILKQDENILKKLFSSMFKIFTMSTVYLEKDANINSTNFTENSNIFVLNVNILNQLMNRISPDIWQKETTERCVLQCLYSLFEKYIHNQSNSRIVFSVLKMIFTFANKQVDFLVKSDFNSLTCLLVSKLFDKCYKDTIQQQKTTTDELVKSEDITWSQVLCLYFDIQTVLLKSLKLLYLRDSIIFFGSYYETIARIIIDSRQSFDLEILQIVKTFSRYLVQISKYNRELLVNLPQSTEYLEQIFCDILHSCISKTRQIKSVSTRLTQQLHATSNTPKTDHVVRAKKEINKCIAVQNILFSIISTSLDGLSNYMPNLGDFNYATHLDEYKLLLTTQLAQPSSFDTYSPFSFGSILWMIDYCLKIAQKNEIGFTNVTKNVATTPKKPDESPSKKATGFLEETAIETKFATKQLIISVLEKLLNLVLAQSVLFERQTQFNARDKKLFRRELSSEINSILQGFNKSFKRTGSTVQYATKSPSKSANIAGLAQTQLQAYNIVAFSSKHTCDFFKFILEFLKQNAD